MTQRSQKPSWHLDDAAAIAAKNPYTFYKPSAQAISRLAPGNDVKLIFAFDAEDPQTPRAERMWVLIQRIEGEKFFGILDNDPAYIRDLEAGDPIEFEAKHIILTDIEDPVPDPTLPYVARCFVTHRVLKGEAPVGYLYREEPDTEDDSGWRITAGDESDEYMDGDENVAYVSLGAVLRRDDSFKELLSTPAPCAFWRNATGRFEPVDP